MGTNYIYALIDNDGLVYYVGKSHDPDRRMIEHKRKLRYLPRYIILEECGDQWRDAERHWITHYHLAGAKLINKMGGGNGADDLSAETKRKLSEAKKGRKQPPGFGAKLSALTKGIPRHWTPEGKVAVERTQFRAGVNNLATASEDGRRRHSESVTRRNKELTPEQRANRQRKAWANLTPEQRAQRGEHISEVLRNSDRLKEVNRSPEKRAASAKGWANFMTSLTPEQREAELDKRRARMREVQKKRWASGPQ